MTPLGEKLRALRAERGATLGEMAAALGVSAAYLSALERGQRGRPSLILVDQICGYFNIIWDEADTMRRLARLRHPRVVIDTTEAGPEATELANRLAEGINDLPVARVRQMLAVMTADN